MSPATDVAEAAAGIVLTDPGLGGIVTCIKEERSAFQRVLTYTMSILVNKCATLVVLGAGVGDDRARGPDSAAGGDFDAGRRLRYNIARG